MIQTDIAMNNAVGDEPTAESGPNPIWLIVLGVLTFLTGFAAIAFPLASSLAVEIMVGSLFLTIGVFTSVHAFMEKAWKAFFWELAMGVLYVAAGIVFLVNPLGGIVALTVLLGTVFVGDGVLRIVIGFQMRPAERWGIVIASGALSALLGILVLTGLANGASLLFIGTLMGINFIFAGVATISLGVALKRGEAVVAELAD